LTIHEGTYYKPSSGVVAIRLLKADTGG